ncbi:hypothetical protein [Moraxella canis]|uniref:Uncharacterized protein n=1 Tax=Moraxella canis TaxID=90239 RepID=A0A1S9ZMR0_9GAMM|nr:hypothetical protein [Moraxella canis]OOR84912.1 hypothetical protein B0180_02050 [Moraxella canis]
MSNLATVFHTAPKWTNVEAIDATDAINSAYKNAELQNKAFNQFADAGADVFKYAQQHRLNEVEKEINAMNLDQFQAADKAALVDGLVAKYGTDIGGFDAANMNRINKYVDDRDTTLINDAVNTFSYNAGLRKDTTEGMQFDADNTASVISTLINTASLLPEGHPDKEPLLKKVETLTADFITKHASGGNVLNQSLQKIKDGDIEAKTRTTQLEAAYADGVTKLYGPSYITYLNQHSDLKKREAEANSLEDPEAKKTALDNIALDRAALTAHYGSDMIESLKNPHILSRLEQKAYEDFHAKRMSEAEYQATISAIENAKKELGIKEKELEVKLHLGEQDNAVQLAAIGAKGDSGRSSSEIKAATETNISRITGMGVSKEIAAGFIGDDGEFSPAKTLATVLNYANKLKTNENNVPNTTYEKSYSSWIASDARELAKKMGVDDRAFNAYVNVAAELGVPEVVKRAIIEAGISGRLDKYYTGNGRGVFDGSAKFFNGMESYIRYVLEKKGMLNVIENEVKDNAYHPNAQEFQKVLNAVEVAYPTGVNGFIQDNAKQLIQNTAFLYYAGPKYVAMVKEAVAKPSKKPSSTNNMSANAGKTLGVQEQPNKLPTPSNVTVVTGSPKKPSTQQNQEYKPKGKGEVRGKVISNDKPPVGGPRSLYNFKKNVDRAIDYFTGGK